MKYVVVVCLLLGTIALNAQSNFLNGYYVRTNQDTVRGFIDYRSDTKSFSICVFKTSPDAGSQSFSPNEILAFGIDDRAAYERHRFKERGGNDLFGFFKVIVRGKLTLLNYDTRYFALTDKGELFDVTRSRSEASGRVKDNFQGLGNLKLLMGDCPTTTETWLLKQYSDRNLKKIFVTYNECVNSSASTFENEKTSVRLNAGVNVMPSLVMMHAGYPMGLAEMNNNKTIIGGAFLSINSPRTWGNVNLLVEANYYQYNGYGFFRSNDGSVDQYNDIILKYKALHIPMLLRFGERFFVDVGALNHLVLSQDLTWRIESNPKATNGVVTSSNATTDAKLNLWSLGLVVGAGAKFEVASFPLRVFVRYSRNGRPFFSDPEYQSASVGISVQLIRN